MTWNTVNVLGISCAGNTAMKLAWEILNVLQCTRWVFGGYFIHFLVMYLQCTCQVHQPLPPVRSDSKSVGGVVGVVRVRALSERVQRGDVRSESGR